jgi:hypothetical protein
MAQVSDWTHGQWASLKAWHGLHARPSALLVVYLRTAAAGTRFGLQVYDRILEEWAVEDFGEARELSVFRVVRFGVERSIGAEVMALGSGPDAERVVGVAAAVLGRPYGPDTIGRDHPAWLEVAQLVGREEARRMISEITRACLTA